MEALINNLNEELAANKKSIVKLKATKDSSASVEGEIKTAAIMEENKILLNKVEEL